MAWADAFNASIYVKLSSPDGSVYETSTRRVLAEGTEESLLASRWGVAVSFHPLGEADYEARVKVLEKRRLDGVPGWQEVTTTRARGRLGAPLEFTFLEEDLALESALFVSRQQ